MLFLVPLSETINMLKIILILTCLTQKRIPLQTVYTQIGLLFKAVWSGVFGSQLIS